MASLLADVDGQPDPAALRTQLQAGLRRLLRAESVEIREAAPASPVRQILPLAQRQAFKIPRLGHGRPAVLEAVARPGGTFDAWDRQLLEHAVPLCALVLGLETGRRPIAHGSIAALRHRSNTTASLIGSSPAIQRLRDRIERVAGTDFTVLIEGESGSGKELVARLIHDLSPRRRGPFVAVNCAALVDSLLEAELFGIEDRTATGVRGRRGKFEHADGGTLFLDEVSDLSSSAQAKLLRAIQELAVERVGGQGSKSVDTRIVVATNRSLAALVAQGGFRADLYYRLNSVEIDVPPLRTRREDVLELAQHFLERHRPVRGLQLSAPVIDALLTHAWPGNVRELERVLERAIALAAAEEI